MTKFLVDECVDQKPIRTIPVLSKGFEIYFPREFSFSGAADISVAALAKRENSVLVTCDSDFFRLHLNPGDISQGVLWFHPPRSSKRAIKSLMEKFCKFRRENFVGQEYAFIDQLVEITEKGVSITTRSGITFHHWPVE
jgi:predicted nuclease of predicted toxin-antitoxin system